MQTAGRAQAGAHMDTAARGAVGKSRLSLPQCPTGKDWYREHAQGVPESYQQAELSHGS